METLLIGRSYSIGERNSFALPKILCILFFAFTLHLPGCLCQLESVLAYHVGPGVSLGSPGLAATAFIYSAIFLA